MVLPCYREVASMIVLAMERSAIINWKMKILESIQHGFSTRNLPRMSSSTHCTGNQWFQSYHRIKDLRRGQGVFGLNTNSCASSPWRPFRSIGVIFNFLNFSQLCNEDVNMEFNGCLKIEVVQRWMWYFIITRFTFEE